MLMDKYLKNIFFYHNPLFLAKELYDNNQTKNYDWIIDWILKKLKKSLKMKILKRQFIMLKESSILTTNKKVKEVHVC